MARRVLLGLFVLAIVESSFALADRAMDRTDFWSIVERSRGDGGEEEFTARLKSILLRSPPEEIALFYEQLFDRLAETRNEDLAAACGLMNAGHVSDDALRYFGFWLIGRGREAFENALVDADSLADSIEADAPAERRFAWESLPSVVRESYEKVTGLPLATSRQWTSRPIDQQAVEAMDLTRKFPRLWQVFGNRTSEPEDATATFINDFGTVESVVVEGFGEVKVGSKLLHSTKGAGSVKAIIPLPAPIAVVRFNTGEEEALPLSSDNLSLLSN